MADRSPSDASQKQVEVVPELQEEKENKESIRFPPEEEAELLRESNSRKSTANSLYAHGEYHQALDIYSQATEICPNYLDYELALLQTNIAACHLKLHEWKNAITAATSSLDKLDKLDADIALEVKAVEDATAIEDPGPFADADHEIRLSDSKRIRYKALMRRARARTELGGWQNLDGAHADYTALQSMDNLTRDDRRLVAAQLALLPAHIKEAKEKEVAQMWDQLKQASRPT